MVYSAVPRIARVVALGLPHHVTQRGNNRCQVFFSDDDRRFYLGTLLKYRRRYGVEVWAYCLMDNHLHALAVPEHEYSLARCFAGTNLVYTQRTNQVQGRSGRLWQNRFCSCPVDRDEYLLPVLRYIETNPVRAGQVRCAWDYEWSSARHHCLAGPDPLLNEPDWLKEKLGTDYKEYLSGDAGTVSEEIRQATATGRPLGSASFVARLESRLGRVLQLRRAGRPRLRR